MLEQFFKSKFRVQAIRNGPQGDRLDGFVQALARAGHKRKTVRRHIRSAEHLTYWASEKGVPVCDLNADVVARFDKHLGRCRCRGFGHACRFDQLRGARSFVGFVSGAGVDLTHSAPPAAGVPALFSAFCEWMQQQRGTTASSLQTYSNPLLALLKLIDEDTTKLDAHSLRKFVLERRERSGAAATKTCTTALRMFVRFLIAQGRCRTGLDAAIPVVANWRLSFLPRYLQAEEVERVVNSCDVRSAVGKRDYAILLLLARLGLRAGDIVTLHMEDIDWKGASIMVSGKGKRETKLPLTQEIGQAIVDYLKVGRPACNSNAIFVRAHAPIRGFDGHWAVSLIVRRAMHRAGVKCQSRGAAHLLRHSGATAMLRHGASLQDIAGVLRHRSIVTTQIYAKVDSVALQRITQPWPEVESC